MTGRIISKPQRHYCWPGWTEFVITDPDIPELDGRIGLRPPDVGTPAGSVWECDCGRTWVAHYPYRNVFAPEFRPERRLERWRRQRRERSNPT